MHTIVLHACCRTPRLHTQFDTPHNPLKYILVPVCMLHAVWYSSLAIAKSASVIASLVEQQCGHLCCCWTYHLNWSTETTGQQRRGGRPCPESIWLSRRGPAPPEWTPGLAPSAAGWISCTTPSLGSPHRSTCHATMQSKNGTQVIH